jgi:hypothetical protein
VKKQGENNLNELISLKDYSNFREHFAIRNDTDIEVQRLSTNNKLKFQGVEYSLNGLQPVTIVSDELKRHSNISISPLWQKSEMGARIVVVKDNDVISYVSIQTENLRGDLIAVTNHIGDGVSQRNISEFVTVTANDFDKDRLKAMKGLNELQHKTMEDLDSVTVREVEGVKAIASAKTLTCSSFKTIEVAIAYDASMCDEFLGDKNRVDAHVQAIVGLASLYYEPSCIKLSLVHIDGTCDKSNDPYAKIATSKSILDEFNSGTYSQSS